MCALYQQRHYVLFVIFTNEKRHVLVKSFLFFGTKAINVKFSGWIPRSVESENIVTNKFLLQRWWMLAVKIMER
jgi:hypothetical protein